jgi:hypothetical protein
VSKQKIDASDQDIADFMFVESPEYQVNIHEETVPSSRESDNMSVDGIENLICDPGAEKHTVPIADWEFVYDENRTGASVKPHGTVRRL